MATVLVIVIALTLAIAFRNTRPGRTRTEALVVVVIAMAVRLVAIFVVFQLGRDNFPTGIWLNDEASFWRATEALLPVPWQGALPQGLDHLGGNGFLGLTSAVAMIGGLDPTSFRLVNVGFGSISALLALWLARHLFGRAAGLTAGIGVALWPTLVLWSATVLRDMLCGFVVLVAWWAVRTFAARDWLRMFCLLALALALLLSLRPYLAAVVFVGSAATVCWPAVRRLRWRWVGFGIVPLIAIGIAVSAQQATRIEQLAHSILYRQTVTRMETLGRLYRDPPQNPLPPEPPWYPGTAIALVEAQGNVLLTGLIDETVAPGVVTVDLTDDTVRTVRTDQLVLLESTQLTPEQLLLWVPENVFSVLTGFDQLNDRATPLWVLDAITWDVLLVMALLGAYRNRVGWQTTIFPTCIVLGTILALGTIPGAPGNADRHRTTQTVPLLLVLASGLAVRRSKQQADHQSGQADNRSPLGEAVGASGELVRPGNASLKVFDGYISGHSTRQPFSPRGVGGELT